MDKRTEKCPQVCPGRKWRYPSVKPSSHQCTQASMFCSVSFSVTGEQSEMILQLHRYGDISNSQPNNGSYCSSLWERFLFVRSFQSRWISVKDVNKVSSPEFNCAAVEMFKLQALYSYKLRYIKCFTGE